MTPFISVSRPVNEMRLQTGQAGRVEIKCVHSFSSIFILILSYSFCRLPRRSRQCTGRQRRHPEETRRRRRPAGSFYRRSTFPALAESRAPLTTMITANNGDPEHSRQFVFELTESQLAPVVFSIYQELQVNVNFHIHCVPHKNLPIGFMSHRSVH
jgi:hypothetical protein